MHGHEQTTAQQHVTSCCGQFYCTRHSIQASIFASPKQAASVLRSSSACAIGMPRVPESIVQTLNGRQAAAMQIRRVRSKSSKLDLNSYIMKALSRHQNRVNRRRSPVACKQKPKLVDRLQLVQRHPAAQHKEDKTGRDANADQQHPGYPH
jgi:uncharacterized alpha-E superfamily protein